MLATLILVLMNISFAQEGSTAASEQPPTNTEQSLPAAPPETPSPSPGAKATPTFRETENIPPARFDVTKKRFAFVETDSGTIKIELFSREAPNTVANFIELAQGLKPFKDARTGQNSQKPFYNGLLVHRVTKGFLIQMGCPLGNGRGGPGYIFNDEFSFRRHDRTGIVGMGNIGPNTNGSQFYITLKPTPHLDGKNTIFGQVVQGMSVVRKIASVKIGPTDRPLKNVYIRNIRIEEK